MGFNRRDQTSKGVTRRQFLRYAGAGLAIAAAGYPTLLKAEGPAETTSWVTNGETGQERLAPGVNALAAVVPVEVDWIDVQTSPDGSNWTEWQRWERDGHGEAGKIWSFFHPISNAAFMRYRLEEPLKVTWHAIKTEGGSGIGMTLMSIVGPGQRYLSRASWSANENNRYGASGEIWERAYRPSQKIIIHHTATPNDDRDPGQTVRVIYHYHSEVLGWGDIGYNYLIDRFGRVYEGRAGGSGVVGGHSAYGIDRQGREGPNYNFGSVGIALIGTFTDVEPSKPAIDALVRLLAWKCAAWNLDPVGHGKFVDKDLPNIMAHRDAQPPGVQVPWLNGGTECCGLALYRQLPKIREAVANLVANQPSRPRSFPIPGGYFFSETSGRGGGVGYRVTNEEGVPFWDEFQRLGGVNAVGYPVTRRFMWNSFLCQAFQKMIFQAPVNTAAWRLGHKQISFINVFDELHMAGKDQWLADERITPPPDPTGPDAGLPWDAVVARHLKLLDKFPDIKAKYMAVGDPLTYHGLPMSAADYGAVRVVRCQRTVFQQWMVNTPWAKAGEVVLANGGENARDGGLFPDKALLPEEPPFTI